MLRQADRFNYFRAFLCDKIDHGGVKQNAISKYIKKSHTYLNKLYKGEYKSCTESVQEKIAGFFGISIEELIRQGENLYNKENKSNWQQLKFEERRSQEPKDLKKNLAFVQEGIDKLEQSREQLIEKIKLYDLILGKLSEGVTFFDADRRFVFSSNRWGLLDDLEIGTTPSVEGIMLTTRKKIVNFDEVSDALFKAYQNREEVSVEVKLVNKMVFKFHVEPLHRDNKFLGMLLTNKPIQT